MGDEVKVQGHAAQDAPGPQSAEEAKWFYDGFASGVTAYAAAVGHSGLKRQNPVLARLLDAAGLKAIGLFEKFGDGGDPPQEVHRG